MPNKLRRKTLKGTKLNNDEITEIQELVQQVADKLAEKPQTKKFCEPALGIIKGLEKLKKAEGNG